jgi:hypothetical protein
MVYQHDRHNYMEESEALLCLAGPKLNRLRSKRTAKEPAAQMGSHMHMLGTPALFTHQLGSAKWGACHLASHRAAFGQAFSAQRVGAAMHGARWFATSFLDCCRRA